MKHLFPISALLISGILGALGPFSANAASLTTKSFGGKVYLTPIPYLTCNGNGASLIMSSNVQGITQLIDSIRGTKDEDEANNKAKNVSGFIPTYATDGNKKPRVMGQILGRQNMIPDMSTCYITTPSGPIYIPVLKTTDNYNVSKN